MKSDAQHLFLRRKQGQGMGARWTLSSLTPSLLIFLITAVLVFALVFISSMTTAIDRMIVMLGSGNIVTRTRVDISSWKGATESRVREGEGVVFTSDGKSIIRLKGVEKDYFHGERGEALKLESVEMDARNPIIVSRTLMERLGLEIGSTMTLMLYEKEKDRTRPLLMTVTASFDSGYAQLDRYLSYVDISLLDGDEEYEILLSSTDSTENRQKELLSYGISSESYMDRYSDLYLNVRQSVMILYAILVFVALLAAFFSTDIVHVYLSRDRRDIAALRLMGMEEGNIRSIYLRLSLFALCVSSISGTLLGILFGNLSPLLIEAVSRSNPGLVEYYISSFSVSIPWGKIVVMLVLMILLSTLSIFITLSHTGRNDLTEEIIQS